MGTQGNYTAPSDDTQESVGYVGKLRDLVPLLPAVGQLIL
jgi:hypothetical protein